MSHALTSSWWTDAATGGDIPGLSLFEDDPEAPGLWEGIKKLFVGGAPMAEGVGAGGVLRGEGGEEGAEDGGRDEYDDFSGAGWEGNNGADDDLDDYDDMAENVVILGVTALIMLLFWLRQRWGQVVVGVGVGAAAGPGPGAQAPQPQQPVPQPRDW